MKHKTGSELNSWHYLHADAVAADVIRHLLTYPYGVVGIETTHVGNGVGDCSKCLLTVIERNVHAVDGEA